ENPEALVVVADGGSSDASRSIVESMARENPRLVLLDNPARIQSAGINLAVAHYGQGCKWLLRLDAHCDYPHGYVRQLLSAAASHDATSVVVPMVTRANAAGATCFQHAAVAAQNSVIGTGGSPHRHLGEGRFVDHGHHALMLIDMFSRVGGYREDMSHNEDAELDLRLAGAGGRIWLEPTCAITYYPRSAPAALWRQYRGYGRGRAMTLRLHRVRPKLRQMLPLAALVAVILGLFSPLYLPLALPLAGWAGLTLGGGALIGLRTNSRCAIAAGFAAMIMHLAWATGFTRGMLAHLPGPQRAFHAN
ncbi:MAG: glycosyltransferase family 2 protein, partial [Novosphingobium sp.]